MNQFAALRDTVRLAGQHGMPELPGSDLGLRHLRFMLTTVSTSKFSDAKLGRWLGWAQCALVAADVGLTLTDMKALNSRHLERNSVAPHGAWADMSGDQGDRHPRTGLDWMNPQLCGHLVGGLR